MKESERVIFPTWRTHWKKLDGLSEILEQADAIVRRRRKGNQKIPSQIDTKKNEDLVRAVMALRAWVGGEPPANIDSRPQIVCSIYAIVQPALTVAAWSRWLMIERGFLDGSATGDLLFAALSLRTMCEELQRLKVLDLSVERLRYLAHSSDPKDQARLQLFLSFSWASLDSLPIDTVLYKKNWPSIGPVREEMPDIENLRRDLNNYVHPNYGNHIVALYPERTMAARLLVSAVIVIYGRFLELSWSTKPMGSQVATSVTADHEAWSDTVLRFQSSTLPVLQEKAEGEPLRTVMKLGAVREWLASNRDELLQLLTDSKSRSLTDSLPRKTRHRGSLHDYSLWDGARAQDLLRFAATRQAESRLAKAFPNGASNPKDQSSWLRFNVMCVELAIMLGQIKETSLKTQLLRQVTIGNVLGVFMCVRSLIEVRAFSVWIARELGTSTKSLATNVRAKRGLPLSVTKALDERLAKFLAYKEGNRKEIRRGWMMHEEGRVRVVRPDLTQIRKLAFHSSDGLNSFYEIASAAIHGRLIRGYEFTFGRDDPVLRSQYIGVLVLERLCDVEEEMDHVVEVLRASLQFRHAGRLGGTDARSTDLEVRRIFGDVRRLVEGEDYTGKGTADEPFRLGPHIEYFQGEYALLGQLGVDTGSYNREYSHSRNGQLCVVWHTSERTFWFEASFTLEDDSEEPC